MKKWPGSTTAADGYKTLTADGAAQIVFADSKVLLALVVEEESAVAYVEFKNTVGDVLNLKPKCDVKGRLDYNIKLTAGLTATVTGVTTTDFRAQVLFKEMEPSEKDY